MNTVINKARSNFSTIPNDLINDDRITDRARFLYVYMFSKPDNWTYYNYQLCTALKYSEDTLRKYLSELIQYGWINKYNQSRVLGKFTANTYVINWQPNTILPCRKNTDTVKNRDRKNKTLSNTNYNNTDHKKNKDFNSLKKKSNSKKQRGASLK